MVRNEMQRIRTVLRPRTFVCAMIALMLAVALFGAQLGGIPNSLTVEAASGSISGSVTLR